MTRRLLVLTTVLVVLSVWTHARPHAAVTPVDFAAVIPLELDEWIGRDAPPLDAAVARVLAADQYVHRYYGIRNPRSAIRNPRIADVEADIAYYARPQAGAAMHSPLNCLPGNGRQIVDTRATALSYDRGTARVRQLIVARGTDRLAMLYWFQNRGAMIGDEYRQRLQLLTNGLQGRPTDAALVRVMALDTPEGHAAMHRFAADIAPLLNARFR